MGKKEIKAESFFETKLRVTFTFSKEKKMIYSRLWIFSSSFFLKNSLDFFSFWAKIFFLYFRRESSEEKFQQKDNNFLDAEKM